MPEKKMSKEQSVLVLEDDAALGGGISLEKKQSPHSAGLQKTKGDTHKRVSPFRVTLYRTD